MKREMGFIKNHITGSVNSTSWEMETMIAFVLEAIAKEDKQVRLKCKFVFIVWSEWGQHAHPNTFKKL